ncbi:hypothetical protein [Pseudonocardia halophobica]|uniref:hypothetical protein n=1 Tax=Pseudonocardia halophobica TaxID=29401 RepID=UPI0012DC86A7|nr:hypothetical protein [Pseudonocardia halophobica]
MEPGDVAEHEGMAALGLLGGAVGEAEVPGAALWAIDQLDGVVNEQPSARLDRPAPFPERAVVR